MEASLMEWVKEIGLIGTIALILIFMLKKHNEGIVANMKESGVKMDESIDQIRDKFSKMFNQFTNFTSTWETTVRDYEKQNSKAANFIDDAIKSLQSLEDELKSLNEHIWRLEITFAMEKKTIPEEVLQYLMNKKEERTKKKEEKKYEEYNQ